MQVANITNHLLIEGKESDIQLLFRSARGQSSLFDFESLVPIPARLVVVDPHGYNGAQKIQEWCAHHWGTKYNCFDCHVSPPRVTFKTAYNVPAPFLKEVSVKFPCLLLTNDWLEDRLNSAGTIVMCNGVIQRSKTEHFSQWQQQKSKVIHTLNVEYNLREYQAFLKSGVDCADNDVESMPYRYYLDLIENK